jgi:hypothetical protein
VFLYLQPQAWLTDCDGEWTVGIRGNSEAEGDWPEFKRGQWVVTNGSSYGYGCARMNVTTDRESMRNLTIKSARALPQRPPPGQGAGAGVSG